MTSCGVLLSQVLFYRTLMRTAINGVVVRGSSVSAAVMILHASLGVRQTTLHCSTSSELVGPTWRAVRLFVNSSRTPVSPQGLSSQKRCWLNTRGAR